MRSLHANKIFGAKATLARASIVVFCLAAHVRAAAAPTQNPEKLAHSLGKRIATSQVEAKGLPVRWGKALAVVAAPPAKVVAQVRDYGNYQRLFPKLTKSKVLAKRGDRAMVYLEASILGGVHVLWAQLTLSSRNEPKTARSAPSTVIEATMRRGNLATFRARWRLTPVQSGRKTLVSFALLVDPDLPLPPPLFSRENQKAAGWTINRLRLRLQHR